MFNVSPVLVLLAIAFNSGVITKSPDKPSGPNCQTFSEGVEFNDTDAVGAWHLLHFRTEKTKGSGDPHCVEFMPIDVKERNRLEKDVGKFVENLDWETLTLKMTIPCKTVESNKTRSYYLERLEDNGSYRTLQLPIYSVKFDFAAFHRYPMRLKLIEGEYLGIMDCHEKFVFIMGKDQPKGKETDERLKKMIETYWPEE